MKRIMLILKIHKLGLKNRVIIKMRIMIMAKKIIKIKILNKRIKMIMVKVSIHLKELMNHHK